jgi:hypothetical protein
MKESSGSIHGLDISNRCVHDRRTSVTYVQPGQIGRN